jgi:hypothetical protein
MNNKENREEERSTSKDLDYLKQIAHKIARMI